MLLDSLPRSLARRFFAVCAVLAATTAALFAQSPSAADGFDPNVNGNVYALLTQADGKILVAGQFSSLRPNGAELAATRNNLARINADGSLDPAFNPNANGPVRVLVQQPDGKILIGGDFTALQPGNGAVIVRNRVARLNADGTVDPTFDPNIGGTLAPQVFALALQADGAVVVGGSFTTVRPAGAAATTNRKNLARFTAAGALDTGYNPNPNGMVLALALHVDGKIVVGGGFTSFQENTKPAATTRNRIARLNVDGTLDTEFNPNANNGVTALAIQRDGKIVLGGYFTTLQPIGNDTVANRVRLARLNVNGTLDSEFYPSAAGNITTIAVAPDGGILIGGTFTSVWGRGATTVSRNYVARFAADGAVDTTFAPAVNSEVSAFAFQADGNIVIGGYFTRISSTGALSATVRNRLARITASGNFDTNFELDAGGRPLVSVVQADGKIVIGGSFTNVGGATHNYLARLNPDGSVDATYNPSLDGRVLAMAYEAGSNKIIVGGSFTTIGGETRRGIARLNPSGTIDSEFNPNCDGQVGAIVLQSDGKILVGGNFASFQPIGVSTAITRQYVARLTATGQVDTPFDPAPNSTVSAIVVQSDGKIVLGGAFTFVTPNSTTEKPVASVTRNRLARLNADGTLDTTYDPNFNSNVTALALQGDGKIVAGGTFSALLPPNATELTNRLRLVRINADGTIDSTFNPTANGNVLAVAVQADGKVLVGGTFTTLTPNGASDWTLRKYAARLNADGTVDSTFNLDLDEFAGNRVDSWRVLADGKILVGGNFASLAPIGAPVRYPRKNFARLNANGTLDTAFDAGAGGAAGGTVNTLAVQSDGKIVAGGAFADLGGAKTTNLARFTPEGNADPGFGSTLAFNGPVNSVAVRANGSPVPTQLAGFAWLNRDGTLRSSFAPGADARLSGQIYTTAVQTDGQLLLGGAFSNLSNATKGNLVRLTATGGLDTSFNPSINGAVTGLVIQADGKIVIVGSFTLVNDTTRNRIARLNANGTLDTAYDPNANAAINAIVLQGDGKVVVGGTFTTLLPNATTTAVTRSYIARINTDGTADTAYNPTANLNVNTLALQADGKVVAGGDFTTVQPNGAADTVTRNRIARFNTDGTLDTNFNPNANSTVSALLVQPDGAIVLGGGFTTLQPNSTTTAVTRNYIARVGSDGALDLAFNPNANSGVLTLALQSDGAIVLGGNFTTLQPNGSAAIITRNRLARIGRDGALDTSFNPDVVGSVVRVATQADGSIFVGGSFSTITPNGLLIVGGAFTNAGGIPVSNIAMINDDGSVNSTFRPALPGPVSAIVALPDGRFVVGGAFPTAVAGVNGSGLVRYNADGSYDATFNSVEGIGSTRTVLALAAQADGKILAGGGFNRVGRTTNLIRLNTTGSEDSSFNAAVTGTVTGLAVQADGKVLVVTAPSAGTPTLRRLNTDGTLDASFTTSTEAIRAIALQSDGRILASGSFTSFNGVAVARLARLNANGTVDTTYNPAPNGAVTALAVQHDGRVMIGGGFTTVGGLARVGLARLVATGSATQMVGVTSDRAGVVWSRAGTAGEVNGVTFERSTDGRTWTTLGTGTRIGTTGNWQLTGQQLPASGLFYIRARGIAPSVAGTSSGLFESAREFNFANPVPAVTAASVTTVTTDTTTIAVDAYSGLATVSVAAAPQTPPVVSTPGTSPVQTVPPPVGGAVGSARLADISTRGLVGATTPLIAGFSISGTGPRTVLVRAVGPSLGVFGVQGVVAQPRLRLYDANRTVIADNSGWTASAGVVDAMVRTGAFAFAANGGADAAVVISLAPGSYTMEVLDRSGVGGIALAEVYDAGTAAESAATRLVNVSSRGTAGVGNGAFIGGFIVTGNTTKNLLVRGIGPALAKFGVASPLADPVVSVYDADGRLLGSNDNWSNVTTEGFLSANTAALSTLTSQAGAFPLDVGSKDAAFAISLPPGAYTVQVAGPAGVNGAAMVEIYELP